ncbi:MAG: phytanoyl-CoA dioxygenase family protein [Chloroflexota bacterium]|nr:phytanoyl-CoA dioxygenase family protein [Chloroflexota bacterium]
MPGLNEAQRQQFADEGFLVVEDVLDPARDFAPVMDEYRAILNGIADTLYAEGAISSRYDDLPFAERLTEICAESKQVLSQHFDFSLPQKGVLPDTPIYTGPAMFRVLANSRLLDLVASVIGPEIFSCPVQHARMKLPKRAVADPANGLIAKIPWHQDNGVLMPEADESSILTVWMPVTEATVENGCMQVIPRSHGRELFDHCPGGPGGLAIPDAVLPPGDPVSLPMKPGSVLLMTQNTVHSSLDNVTPDQVRISFDLRFQPIGQPTGRPAFAQAGFVARSAAHPESVVRDPAVWSRNWLAVRDHLAAREDTAFNRWRADAAACA